MVHAGKPFQAVHSDSEDFLVTQLIAVDANTVRVLNNGRVRTVPMSSIAGMDADIDAALTQAQESRGTPVTVCAVSHAKWMRPRNSAPATRIIL